MFNNFGRAMRLASTALVCLVLASLAACGGSSSSGASSGGGSSSSPQWLWAITGDVTVTEHADPSKTLEVSQIDPSNGNVVKKWGLPSGVYYQSPVPSRVGPVFGDSLGASVTVIDVNADKVRVVQTGLHNEPVQLSGGSSDPNAISFGMTLVSDADHMYGRTSLAKDNSGEIVNFDSDVTRVTDVQHLPPTDQDNLVQNVVAVYNGTAWATIGHDQRLVRIDIASGTITPVEQELAATYKAGVLIGGRVALLVTGDPGEVVFFDAATGALDKTVVLPEGVIQSITAGVAAAHIVVAGDSLVVGGGDNLAWINPETGEFREVQIGLCSGQDPGYCMPQITSTTDHAVVINDAARALVVSDQGQVINTLSVPYTKPTGFGS